jgi:predicted PurR-regulated permease PerM
MVELRNTESGTNEPSGVRIVVVCASLVVIMAGLRAAAPILLPVALALLLTIFSLPLLAWLQGLGVRISLAVAVTMLLMLGLVSAFGVIISRTASSFLAAAPGYVEMLEVKAMAVVALVEQRGIDLSNWISLDRLDANSMFDMGGWVLGGTVRGVASMMSFITLVALAMVFMLPETVVFRDKLAAALGAESKTTLNFQIIVEEIERYLELKTIVSAATGLLIGLWVALLGVPFPLLWGLVGFLFNYVPNIGSILASLAPVLLTLIQYGSGRALVVAAGYLAINLFLGNVIEPKLMGRRFGLSTLVVILSLIFWGWLWGPLGMLLAVPLTVILKIALTNSEHLQWVAVLLGPSPLRAEEARPSRVPLAKETPRRVET